MKHLLRKILCLFKRDPRWKWPRDVWDAERVIYPYFLQAFELNPETEYEKARDILDACLEDVYKAVKGERPKVQMDHGADIKN